MLAGFALVALLVLLGGVATGYFFAVEAAAMGAFALLSAGLVSGRLRGAVLRELLHDAIAITGALFSLLIAATTFTLVLRLLGTDRLVNNLVAAIPGGDILAVAVVLAVIGLCAFVLDAFEIIFVIVPIVIPPLLIRVADARWVSVLVLLTLQSSFLLPPFGYALMMVRGAAKKPAPFRPFVRALIPFLVAQWMLLVLVLLVPKLVHIGENAADNTRAPAAPVSRRGNRQAHAGNAAAAARLASRNEACLTPLRPRLKTLSGRANMIVLIDNYDSFTFNLFHYLGGLGGGRRRASQRQDFDRRGDRRRAGRDRALARPLHAERSRHLPRSDRQGRADHPDPRRLPRPSGDRPGVRRQGGARARRCTARCSRSSTRAPACSAASTGRSRRRAITRWWSSAPACRAN